MVPEDAVALPLYNLVSSLGMVNSYSALIFPGAASGLAMFLFTQFFKEIPKSLVEAARIDGASDPGIFQCDLTAFCSGSHHCRADDFCK